ncbi:hypothetical protein AB0F59_27335 [Micromonospora lupini]|uniref:hypothetical protein n=1 Tax=Micromonospora lupini TaxID=285679 RepID=UPI0033EA2432
MLIIAEERDTYPPNGQIPNLETDEKACDDILARIRSLLPGDLTGEVVGALVNWSASVLLPHQSFGTWAEAITAATSFARNDMAHATDDSQRQRNEAVGGDDLATRGLTTA